MNSVVRPGFIGWMRGLGFRSLSELLPMRAYDLLNMNRIDAIKAEEIIISLYRHIHLFLLEIAKRRGTFSSGG